MMRLIGPRCYAHQLERPLVPEGRVGLLPRSGYTEQPRALALGYAQSASDLPVRRSLGMWDEGGKVSAEVRLKVIRALSATALNIGCRFQGTFY
jgi:hypothetical protein